MVQIARVKGLHMQNLRLRNSSDLSVEIYGPQDFTIEDIEVQASKRDGISIKNSWFKSSWFDKSTRSQAPRRGVVKNIVCDRICDDNIALQSFYRGGLPAFTERASDIEISDVVATNGISGNIISVARCRARQDPRDQGQRLPAGRGPDRTLAHRGLWLPRHRDLRYRGGADGRRSILHQQDDRSTGPWELWCLLSGNGNRWRTTDPDVTSNYLPGDAEIDGLTIRNVKAQVHHVHGISVITQASNWDTYNADCMRNILIENFTVTSTQQSPVVPLHAADIQGVKGLTIRNAKFEGFSGSCIRASRYAMAFEGCNWVDCHRDKTPLIDLGTSATVANSLQHLDKCQLEVRSGSFARIWNAAAPAGEGGSCVDTYAQIGGSSPTDVSIVFKGSLHQEWTDPDGQRRTKPAPRANTNMTASWSPRRRGRGRCSSPHRRPPGE